jgi:predicted acylesterase/phospholipase RssA
MHTSIRRIAFGGGGAKGILHIGVLRELAKTQTLEFPDGIYGSSVGAIIATCVAFKLPLDGMLQFVRTYSSIDSLIPQAFDVHNISKVFSKKGMYEMDTFEKRIIELFETNNISIQDKKLNQADMPLHIVASNITLGKPTVFSGNIRVLDALKCSCCIPLLFRPIELYGQLYIDGDILSPCIASVVPQNTVSISLTKKGKRIITPSVIDYISPLDYTGTVYSMIMDRFQKSQATTMTLQICYPKLTADSDLAEYDIDKILDSASRDLSGFLGSQSLYQ